MEERLRRQPRLRWVGQIGQKAVEFLSAVLATAGQTMVDTTLRTTSHHPRSILAVNKWTPGRAINCRLHRLDQRSSFRLLRACDSTMKLEDCKPMGWVPADFVLKPETESLDYLLQV